MCQTPCGELERGRCVKQICLPLQVLQSRGKSVLFNKITIKWKAGWERVLRIFFSPLMYMGKSEYYINITKINLIKLQFLTAFAKGFKVKIKQLINSGNHLPLALLHANQMKICQVKQSYSFTINFCKGNTYTQIYTETQKNISQQF